MTLIFTLLLMFFLAGFFIFPYYDIRILGMSISDFFSTFGVSISATQIRIMSGVGIIFCELAIIAFSMLDRIADTIKETIRPLFRLIPLAAFLMSVWNTFSRILFSLLPANFAAAMGTTKTDVDIAQAVNSGSFSTGVLLTLATMIFFILSTYFLRRSPDSEEVRALRAELAKYKRLV